MRRAPLLLPLLATASLLAGCGKSLPRAPSRHSRAAAPSAAEPKALTVQRALAFARAVNLTRADVPGFSISTTHERRSAEERRLERRMLGCAGSVGAGQGLAEASSPSFELKRSILDLSVSSEVSVARSAVQAAHELDAIRSPRVRSCFSRYLDLLFKGKRVHGANAGAVSIAAGIPPAPGASGGYAWRVVATFTVQRIKLPLYLDILGFAYGPARVTLFSSGVLRPFPAAIQQGLYSLLLARAKATGL